LREIYEEPIAFATLSVLKAYHFFEETIRDLRRFRFFLTQVKRRLLYERWREEGMELVFCWRRAS